MIKEEKNQMNLKITKISGSDNIPELRFPEFKNEGEWGTNELNDFCFNISSGKDKNSDVGEFELYGSTGIIGRTESASYNGDYILIARVGANAGLLNRAKGKFGVTDNTLVLALKKVDSIDFIHHSLDKIGLNKLVFGSGQPLITGGQLKSLQILSPRVEKEQQRIASCLSSLDEVIAAHSQKLELLKDHKKGLMQNLFPHPSTSSGGGSVAEPVEAKVPKYRFKEFENDGEWVEKRIKDVFSIFQGFAFSSEDSVPSGVRWLKIADVGIQKMKEDNPTFLPANFINEYRKFLVKKGDYVLALTRPILNMELKIAPVDDTFHNALLNQRVGKIMTSQSSSFVYYLLHTKKMVVNINKNIAGNEPPNLSFQQIENIDVYIPREIKEQQKIASCLSSLDALIAAQADKIEQLKLHKKGLMQGLFPKTV